MNYQTFEPSHNLKPIVQCYWTLDGAKEETVERQSIVPDGCMEMIFHYGDLYLQFLPDGEAILQPRCFVFGQLSRPLEIQPTGITGIFAVRFKPDGFAPFATVSLSDIKDKAVPMHQLFEKDGETLAQSVIESNTTSDRIRLVENFLLMKLQQSEVVNELIRSTIDAMLESRGKLAIKDISIEKRVSRRSIERRMVATTGLSPKKLSKIIRLQSILKQLINGKHTSLTALAYDADYYDQSHFIKDFKDITGITPKQFYGDNLKMSSIFYGES